MSDFKVGDWVKNKYKTIKVKSFITLDKIDYIQDSENGLMPVWQAELWQPKEGEWCWFDKNKLGKFWKKQGTRNYWTLSDFVSISEKTKIPSGDYFVSDYCEPFIGQLPSFIKDKQ